MAYFLRSFAGAIIPIEDEAGTALDLALDCIQAQIAFEELWETVVQNLLDLERDVLNHSLDDMLFGGQDWNYFQDMRTLFARRLANLLSSCRAYIDLAPRQLRIIGHNSGLETRFAKLKSEAYEQHFSFRLMEALRNYTQHYGSPISATHLDSRWMEHGSRFQLRHVTGASISAHKLRSDMKFKASVRAELANKDKLEVNKHTREYIEQLNKIHLTMRSLTIESGVVAHSIIMDAMRRIKDKSGDSDFGAYLAVDTRTDHKSLRALMCEPFERLKLLGRRNHALEGLASRYVSGELLDLNLR
ncbi:hypothetical protein [Sphingomonas sp. CFBP 13720]|uniref:hypothetical protein n=1 Tax=Sphingomonas sp. CFBP 13720 TaxID=2775302 RepID=UPI00177C62BC|nr:hypothetical protein [Sphingomonas sp. CFBP 13720]MBD8679256.1 hypothetical protein [Sphingomonas sp. CFBP 13720]